MPNSLESDIVAALGDVAAEAILAKLSQRSTDYASTIQTERAKVAAKIAEVSAVQDDDQRMHEEFRTTADAQLAAAVAERKAAQDEAKDAVKQRNQLASALTEAEARIAELELALNPPTPPLIGRLNDAYKAGISGNSIPPELQASLATYYAIVRVLVLAGELEMAVLTIRSIQLPEELESVRAQLIALIQQPQPS